MAFELINNLINYLENQDSGHMFLKNLVVKLYTLEKTLEKEKSNTLYDFKRSFVLFLSKCMILFSNRVMVQILESIEQNFSITLLFSEFNSIGDIESFSNRKIVLYAYLSFFNEYYSSLGKEYMLIMTKIFIKELHTFYKMSSLYVNDESKLDLKRDLYAAEAHYTKKLVNAKIEVLLFI